MILCIAEKPSVARDIARILGATSRKEGYFEGKEYCVTWTFGHLCTLKEPHDYTPLWKKWALSALPIIPPRFGIKLINNDGIQKQFSIIESLVKRANTIINCGDAGQEGELIQRWVLQKAKASCSIRRLWISSMTDEAVKEGFRTLKDASQYDDLYMAGLSRAIGDWLLGMNATRLYTLKYGQSGQILSIGRVQTPTLALIVKRQKEIEDFQAETYWTLTTTYRGTIFNATKGKFTSQQEAKNLLSVIEGKPFKITSIQNKEEKEPPPRLYDLTTLQVECNRRHSFSAETTLNVLQNLYEKKFTTYPRVDTQYLTEDIYDKCPTILQNLVDYKSLVEPIANTRLKKSKRIFDNSKVTDHHAIIPTEISPKGISQTEQMVYDMVARRFIGVFYPDCKYATTAVEGKVEDVSFKASGKTILEKGWRVTQPIVERKNIKGEQDEKTLPVFSVNESGPHQPIITEKHTSPPPYYTEATLLRAMEAAGKFVEDEELRTALKENGIGRPSSRAAIIETLFKRNYIKRNKKNIVATHIGVKLIGIIKNELLKSPELTGIWEKKLRDIEKSKYSSQQFINELKKQVEEMTIEVLSDNISRRIVATEDNIEKTFNKEEIKVGDKCPLCKKGTIIKGHTAYGCSEWKKGCNWRKPFNK